MHTMSRHLTIAEAAASRKGRRWEAHECLKKGLYLNAWFGDGTGEAYFDDGGGMIAARSAGNSVGRSTRSRNRGRLSKAAERPARPGNGAFAGALFGERQARASLHPRPSIRPTGSWYIKDISRAFVKTAALHAAAIWSVIASASW